MNFDKDKIEEILFRENLTIAPLSKRIIAFLVDDFLISFLFFIMFYGDFMQFYDDKVKLMEAIGSVVFYVILLRCFYHGIFTFFYGASLGKMLVKIKIIQVDNLDTPNLPNTVLRCFFRELGQNLLYITYFFALENRLFRTLHDRIAKTIVINQE